MKDGSRTRIEKQDNKSSLPAGLQMAGLFLAGRLILFGSITYSGLAGYTDYWNFFNQAGLGIPFIDYWTEFPPMFPFLSRIIFLLSSGSEHTYGYITAGLMTLFQSGSILLVYKLGLFAGLRYDCTLKISGSYSLLTLGLFYGWGYFDAAAVFLMLLGLYLALKGRPTPAGLVLGLGGLTKWFPLFVLPAVLKNKRKTWMLQMLGSLILLVGMVWVLLFAFAPGFTVSSVQAQFMKGSWETVYALIEGNVGTGNFGQGFSRLVPLIDQKGLLGTTINRLAWGSLLVIGAGGAYLWWKASLSSSSQIYAFVGLTTVMFFIWSPGYSPQWILYILPLLILVLPFREALLWSIVLILISLLEWPLLLSRGLFKSLYWLIPLRTFLFALLGYRYVQQIKANTNDQSRETASSY
jgi:hypothetical protein